MELSSLLEHKEYKDASERQSAFEDIMTRLIKLKTPEGKHMLPHPDLMELVNIYSQAERERESVRQLLDAELLKSEPNFEPSKTIGTVGAFKITKHQE